ncbi:hypothetical protein JCM21714_1980 [Gracilibacillus boraciitolerans JCM 21714]|uniref:EF-hand domain-containing protein n=1 Tax=Gracilibacillus boraciitolerans JCM 21714 TaxID=1298598 RepID=W4VII4_9BACI|nr:hypothetical protein JCM21714_1980 [Gracilibacillus boraciitolerans JCM 21714]
MGILYFAPPPSLVTEEVEVIENEEDLNNEKTLKNISIDTDKNNKVSIDDLLTDLNIKF